MSERYAVLVCGGRDYVDRATMWRALDAVHALRPITLLVHGGARGADALAGYWAEDHGVDVVIYPVNWQGHGKSGGPRRNARMLERERPVAFPGGPGTADMTRQAEWRGVLVQREHG